MKALRRSPRTKKTKSSPAKNNSGNQSIGKVNSQENSRDTGKEISDTNNIQNNTQGHLYIINETFQDNVQEIVSVKNGFNLSVQGQELVVFGSNGSKVQCGLCDRKFTHSHHLNRHFKSDMHLKIVFDLALKGKMKKIPPSRAAENFDLESQKSCTANSDVSTLIQDDNLSESIPNSMHDSISTTITDELKKLFCPLCKVQCYSLENFVKHKAKIKHVKEASKSIPIPQICSNCHKKECVCPQLAELAKSKGTVCSICEKEFSCQSSLRAHIKTHDKSVRHYCFLDRPNCKKGYSSEKNLHFHQMVKHPHLFERKRTVTKYPCDICNQIFWYKSTRDRHVVKVHAKKTLSEPTRISTVLNSENSDDNTQFDFFNANQDQAMQFLNNTVPLFNSLDILNMNHINGDGLFNSNMAMDLHNQDNLISPLEQSHFPDFMDLESTGFVFDPFSEPAPSVSQPMLSATDFFGFNLPNTEKEPLQKNGEDGDADDDRTLAHFITGYNHPRTRSSSAGSFPCHAEGCLVVCKREYDLQRHFESAHVSEADAHNDQDLFD